MEKGQQELMQKFQMFEQQIQQTQQQLQAVDQALIDLNTINLGLDELKGQIGKEILAPIGKGIFAKAKLVSEELIVDVGNKNFITKQIPETQDMIISQTKKIEEIKNQLEEAMKEINSELTKTMMQAQKKKQCCGKHENCECEGQGCEDNGCAEK